MDDDIEADIAKEEAQNKLKDPFEKLKQRLRTKQETIHEVPDHPYVKIEIPATGKIGSDCTIKISEKVPHVQVAISQDIQWKKRDKYDRLGKPELVCRAFIMEELKNKDIIKIPWADNGVSPDQKMVNLLAEGEYMVEVHAYGNEAWEDVTARRLVQVTK